jgi:hypothetical protein
MATTTNYGWTTPDDTALVKDGAAAIRTLGSSVDTTTKALNPSTTLGDIEYRSSTANTNTRLGIGTSGQVLGISGGVPAWTTPAAGSANAVGLTRTQSISSGATTDLTTWTEIYDSNSYYTSGATITVPSTGKYKIELVYLYAANSTGYRTIELIRNGSTLLTQDFQAGSGASFNNVYGIINQVFSLTAADSIKASTYHNGSTTLSLTAALTITYLGA